MVDGLLRARKKQGGLDQTLQQRISPKNGRRVWAQLCLAPLEPQMTGVSFSHFQDLFSSLSSWECVHEKWNSKTSQGTEFLKPPPIPKVFVFFFLSLFSKCQLHISWFEVPTALPEGGANASEMSRNCSVYCLNDSKTNRST